MDQAASTLLISQAAELSDAIFSACKSQRLKPSDLERYRIANDIAVALHLIREYLTSIPPYWIDPEVEGLCSTVLRDLQNITRPTKKPSYFASPFNWNYATDLETCIVSFFKTRTEDARKSKITCDGLLSKLNPEENSVVELPDSTLKLKAPASSDDFNNSIFETLQLITLCDPELHELDGAALTGQHDLSALRHAARLCLHETESQDSAARNIAILVSAMNKTIWQEFCLRMYVYS
jgi:hypothetical protein